jgi:hypothetical protein
MTTGLVELVRALASYPDVEGMGENFETEETSILSSSIRRATESREMDGSSRDGVSERVACAELIDGLCPGLKFERVIAERDVDTAGVECSSVVGRGGGECDCCGQVNADTLAAGRIARKGDRGGFAGGATT